MKKFRFLLALAVVVVMMSTVALAADLEFTMPDVEYADEITVAVYANQDLAIGGFYGEIVFEPAGAWKITETSDAGMYPIDSDVKINIMADGITLSSTEPIFTFKAVAQSEDAKNSTFKLVNTEVYDSSYINVLLSGEEICAAQVTAAAPAQDPTYTGTVGVADLNGASGEVYTNVWTGNYTVTLNGNAITKIGLRFAGKSDEAFAVAKNADGNGSVTYKVAIVGAPKGTAATPIVYTTEWIAAVDAE